MNETTVYFGNASANEVRDNGAETFFTSEETPGYFWYRMTVSPDQTLIEDTCGRKVPIDVTASKQLGTAVFIANSIYQAQEQADALYNQKMTELAMIVEHMNDHS